MVKPGCFACIDRAKPRYAASTPDCSRRAWSCGGNGGISQKTGIWWASVMARSRSTKIALIRWHFQASDRSFLWISGPTSPGNLVRAEFRWAPWLIPQFLKASLLVENVGAVSPSRAE